MRFRIILDCRQTGGPGSGLPALGDFGPDNPAVFCPRKVEARGGFRGRSTLSLTGRPRVSTTEGRQVLVHPLDALGEAGYERVFEELAAGACSNLAAA